MICGRDEAKGRAKADEIATATGSEVVFVQADLEAIEDCAKVVAEADKSFGRVDALVNAAGDTSRGTIISCDAIEFRARSSTSLRCRLWAGSLLLLRIAHRKGRSTR